MTSRFLRNFLLLLAALAVLIISPALAQGRGQGNAHQQKDKNRMEEDRGNQGEDEDRDEGNNDSGKHQVGVQMTVPVFGPRDRDLIGVYYQNGYSNLPPGLAKRRGNLPPGLQKQLQRNGTLPAGLQKRLQPFPLELSRQLPLLPSGYTRGLIGGSAEFINQRTRAIVDVINNVLNRSGI